MWCSLSDFVVMRFFFTHKAEITIYQSFILNQVSKGFTSSLDQGFYGILFRFSIDFRGSYQSILYFYLDVSNAIALQSCRWLNFLQKCCKTAEKCWIFEKWYYRPTSELLLKRFSFNFKSFSKKKIHFLKFHWRWL